MPSTRVSSKSSKSWKDVQSKTKLKKRTKLALVVLGLLFGFLIISWAVHFTQNLFGSKQYSWNGEFNINFLLRLPSISLLSYSPQDGKVTIINIPDETFLEVPSGFGSWQLRSVYDLGESQKGVGGDKLLKDTLTHFFAVPIDGFIDFDESKSPQSAAEFVEILRRNPLSGLSLLSSLKTDLTMWELIKLKFGISSVRFDKIQKLDLIKLNILEKGSLADGTPIYTSDQIKLDSLLTDLQDPAIVSEHKSIAVFNATEQAQLAQKWARLITNLGGNVIITSNSKVKLKNTQILGEQSPTLKRLQQIFALDCSNSPKCDKQSLPFSDEKGKISPTDEDIVSQRAQINLLLGEDYINK